TGYHNDSLRYAVEQVCGSLPADGIWLAGRTDTDIVHEMIASTGGRPTPEAVQRVFDLAVADFEQRCPPDLTEFVIDGVWPALERLRGEGATMGLVTGNIQRVAWRKMDNARLREFFSFGGFGDESA